MSEQDMAAVLAEHRIGQASGGTAMGSTCACSCGEQNWVNGTRDMATRRALAHVAQALAAAGFGALDAAREDGYWIGYREGRDEAETRDLSFDELTERANRAEAALASAKAEALREAADVWDAAGTVPRSILGNWLRDRADQIARTDERGRG